VVKVAAVVLVGMEAAGEAELVDMETVAVTVVDHLPAVLISQL
jgi:hypothetical protein